MYLIDGNNLMGRAAQEPGARRQLMAGVARLAAVRKLRLTIVFDGAPEQGFPDGARYRGVGIFYARANSDADARIIEMAEAERNKKNMVVVTADQQLGNRVRVCGVRVIGTKEFRRMLDEAAATEPTTSEPRVERAEMDQWLRYFGVDEEEDES